LQDGSNRPEDSLKRATTLSRLTKYQNGDSDHRKVLFKVWKVATFQTLFSFWCVFGISGVVQLVWIENRFTFQRITHDPFAFSPWNLSIFLPNSRLASS